MDSSSISYIYLVFHRSLSGLSALLQQCFYFLTPDGVPTVSQGNGDLNDIFQVCFLKKKTSKYTDDHSKETKRTDDISSGCINQLQT